MLTRLVGRITPILAFFRRGGRDFLRMTWLVGITPILTFPRRGGRDFPRAVGGDDGCGERTPFTGEWPPAMAQWCVRDSDPIGAFYGGVGFVAGGGL